MERKFKFRSRLGKLPKHPIDRLRPLFHAFLVITILNDIKINQALAHHRCQILTLSTGCLSEKKPVLGKVLKVVVECISRCLSLRVSIALCY